MGATSRVLHYVQRTPRGKPFTTSTLMQFGARAAVDQALSRLTGDGKIVRLTRGVYVRPEQSRFVGKVLPEPFKIAEVIAKKTNEVIQISGAEAARQFSLSTQVPAQPIFLTTGPSRKFTIGALEVTLKHVSRKKIPLTKSKAGLAILALWYLGKNQVDFSILEKIEKKLSLFEFKEFSSSQEYMPAWMSNLILKYNGGEKKHV